MTPTILYRNLLTPGIVREVIEGSVREWTWADLVAAARCPLRDLRRIAVWFLLDYTGSFGDAIHAEVITRRSVTKARAIGSECFCCYHDCDTKDCPPGEHE